MPQTKTKIKKENGWTFTSYWFCPQVIYAEKVLNWRDEERLWELKKRMRRDGYLLSWNDEENKTGICEKKTTRIEVYMRVNKDLPIMEKVEKIKQVIERYGIADDTDCEKGHK
jgi:hypothetical protein